LRRIGGVTDRAHFVFAIPFFPFRKRTPRSQLAREMQKGTPHHVRQGTVCSYVPLHAVRARATFEALEMAQRHAGPIDVLLTDIVMPGLRGSELARRVSQVHPEIRVLYMSGYAEDFQESQLPEDSVFLQKPFRFATLLEQLKLVRRRS
jgi:two-component system cell cycle sensor histidine kinase/response regulator CckA